MPTVELGLFDHLIFLVLAVVFPLDGRYRFRALRAANAAGDPNARMRSYRLILIQEWLATAVVLVIWLVLGRGLSSLGLAYELSTPAVIGYAVAVAVIAGLVWQGRSVTKSAESRTKVRASLDGLLDLMPRTGRERSAFNVVSVTAGLCEEFLYRGFLLAYLASWMPEQPTWLVVLAGGALFGLAHAYQGGVGILKTGTVGVVLGLLYWATGSIWASVVLHAVIDLNSGWIGWRVQEAHLRESVRTATAA